MASASAGAINLTTAVVTVFDEQVNGGPCEAFYVYNDAASAGDAQVNVDGLHKASEYLNLPPGQGLPFKNKQNLIRTITAKAVSTATIKFGVIAK